MDFSCIHQVMAQTHIRHVNEPGSKQEVSSVVYKNFESIRVSLRNGTIGQNKVLIKWKAH